MKNPINHLQLFILAAFLSSALSVFAQSQPYSNNTQELKSATNILVTADVNSDGKKDVVTASKHGNSVQFFLNLLPGQDANQAGADESISFQGNLVDFSCIDLNRDKFPDLIVADEANSSLQVFTNKATAETVQFSSPSLVLSSNKPNILLSCDLNFDGYPEVIVAGETSVVIYQNVTSIKGGEITLQEVGELNVGVNINSIKCAEIDGDGIIDIIVGTNNGFIVYARSGIAAAYAKAFTMEEFTITSQMDIGDIDGDYLPELVLSQWPQNEITIIRNISQPGRPAFTKEKPINCLGAADIVLSDYNQDGLFDILTLANGQGWQLAQVFINKTAAQGRFAFMSPMLININSDNLLATDIDNNGYDDFVTANSANGLVNIIYNNKNSLPSIFSSINVFCGEDGFTWMEWALNEEQNNTKYSIERSYNGADFVEIGTVDAKDSGEAKNEYGYTDVKISNEIAAYRIKADANGVKVYSPVILQNPCDNVVTDFVCVFPNPVEKVMHFQFSLKAEMELNFEILDELMQTKLEKTEYVTPGTRTYAIDISKLEKGSYLLAVRFGNLAPKVCRFEKL